MTKQSGMMSIAILSLALSSAAADEQNGCPDSADADLSLPDGFCAQEVATDLGRLGQMAITGEGDVYAALQDTEDRPGGIIGLRDSTDDGVLDEQVMFGERGATGLAIEGDRLYVSERQRILSSPLHPDRLGPGDTPRVIAHDLPDSPQPRALLVRDDVLYTSVAADSRYCEADGEGDAAGQDPCKEREQAAGIWRFSRQETGQRQDHESRFAAGIRDATAMHWNSRDDHLYAIDTAPPTSNGEGALANAMLRVTGNSDFGWPYCIFSTALDRHLQAAAYGGDGISEHGCSPFERPLHPLSGGAEPTALLFYGGHQFPEAYRRAAYIAYSGRGDDEEAGIKRVPVDPDGRPTGSQKRFADGFAADDSDNPRRRLDLAQGPDGSLFVSDSQTGTIWRIDYSGGDNDSE